MAATALPESFARGRKWTVVHRYERGGRLYVVAREDGGDARTPHRLSTREREVVTLVLGGLTNKEIAFDLGLASSTVRVLLMRACAKMGARSRAELVAMSAKPKQLSAERNGGATRSATGGSWAEPSGESPARAPELPEARVSGNIAPGSDRPKARVQGRS